MGITDGKRHAQRHAFALASQLIQRFNPRGITEADFWASVKADYGVRSRSEIGELGYVRLSARLQAAQRHEKIFESLCREITAITGDPPQNDAQTGCFK